MIGRLWRTLRPNKRNREIEEELAFHVAMRAREYEAAGMSPAEAARTARRKFGPGAAIREETREAHILPTLETIRREAAYSLRALRRRPALFVTGVLTLALGIGFNIAIGAAVDVLLFRPLPVPDSERLLVFVESRNGNSMGGNPVRMRDYATMRSFSAIGGFYSERLATSSASGAKSLSALRLAGDVIGAFGYRMAIGRGFTAEELQGNTNSVVVSHRYWQREFGGRGDVLGATISTRAGALRVAGVLSPEASLIEEYDLWLPASPSTLHTPRTAGFLMIVARLRDGVSPAEANAELQTKLAAMIAANPSDDKGLAARVGPLNAELARQAREPALLLLAVVVTVLLTACLNLAGLLVARNAERAREISIRLSIGAGRFDLIRLFLWEAVWLALFGGITSLVVAQWSLDLLIANLPKDLPLLATMRLDARMIAFALAVSVLCAFVIGLVPAWQASRLKHRPNRLRAALVALQIGVSMVLLSAALFFGQSLQASKARPIGFQPDNVVALEFDFPWDSDGEELNRFYTRVESELLAIPGARSAGIGDALPLLGSTQARGYLMIHGVPLDDARARRQYQYRVADAGFFAALRIPLLRGRWPEPPRTADSPRETVVNESFVRRYFGAVDPIGRRVSFADANREPRWHTIAGVVPDVAMSILDERPSASVYVHHTHAYWPRGVAVLHAAGDAEALVRAARAKVAAVDPYAMIRFAGPAEARVESVWSEPSLLTALVGGMALLTLSLVCLGVYGVCSSMVRARTREFGIRAALGATPRSLAGLSLRHGLRLAAAGVLLGGIASIPARRLIEGLLLGSGPGSIPTVLAASGCMMLVVCFACFGPARRAARMDPAIVLRHE